jgi:trimeric autotransporter adhesin
MRRLVHVDTLPVLPWVTGHQACGAKPLMYQPEHLRGETMNVQFKRMGIAVSGAALLIVAGCGGGGGGGSTPTPPVSTTTNVTTTVIDGALRNALVCLDKNSNGQCDADEVQGRTDTSGNVTLVVPNADAGKYPLVAVVGTDAVDADHGPVMTAYTLSAPADQTGVVSPLTTLVQQTIATTGATTAEAAQSVQDATGLSVSLFQDFTKVAAPTDGSVSAATVARMMVVTTQRQTSTIASTVGTTAVDNTVITQADLDKAIQKKLLELLPSLVAALSDPAVLAATTPTAKDAALLAAATTLVTNSGLTPAAMATVVAINNQTSTPTTVTPPTPAAGFNLRALNFTDASNYFMRVFTGSLAQNTPDSSNNVKYVERRQRSTAGNLAKWGSGSDPARGADLHWNGSAWTACPINYENTSSVRDALGNNVYTYCDGLETGRGNRASFDVSGKTLAEVYAQIIAAGYTNLTIANAATVLGSATFPTGSALFYQSNTPLTEAVAYYPAGANSPVGTSNIVSQYSLAVSAGGNAATQGAGVGCNSTEASGSGTSSTTLEGMIAAKTGTPCVFAQSSFVYNTVTYTDAPSAWWGNSTVSLGKIGTVPLNSGIAPGFFSGNTLLRVGFTGGNAVTYYSCKERFNNGSPRNCTSIGTGTYTITSLGDARVLSFNNLPVQTAPLNYTRAFVERGGAVYFGYVSKPIVVNSARLNTIGATALLTQLGLTPEDPSAPLALTAGSYQGIWDIRGATEAVSPTIGVTITMNASGGVSCAYKSTPAGPYACTLAINNPATGAFSYTNTASGATASGFLDFMAGTASGTYNDPSTTPMDGALVGGRR